LGVSVRTHAHTQNLDTSTGNPNEPELF